MKNDSSSTYQKPEMAKVKVISEENIVAGQRFEAYGWPAESCYKICRGRTRDNNKPKSMSNTD